MTHEGRSTVVRTLLQYSLLSSVRRYKIEESALIDAEYNRVHVQYAPKVYRLLVSGGLSSLVLGVPLPLYRFPHALPERVAIRATIRRLFL